MMQFWIGESQEYMAVEYAKSNRSTCRECKQKIAKDELRIGLLTDSDQMPLSYWHHLNCFHFKPRHKPLEHEQMIEMVYGIDDIDSDDCDKVLEYLEQELKNFLENKYVKKKPKTKKGNKSEKQDSDSDSDFDKKDTKKSKATKKNKTQEGVEQEKGKKAKKTKSKKQETEKKFMSSQQQKTYQEYYEKYLALSTNDLKAILQKNFQPKTGAKDALAAMCADGEMFGRIPNCPTCAGGKLRFDREKGTYKCPGYMEDTQFKHCRATFNFDEIKRLEWVE